MINHLKFRSAGPMDESNNQNSFRRQTDALRLALLYSQKAVTCLSASIDAYDHNDSERAEYFSRMAIRHNFQAQSFLSSSLFDQSDT